MKPIVLSLLACLIFINGFSQTPKSFPEEDAAFIEAFTEYIQKSKRQASIDAAVAFTETFNSLSADKKAAVKLTGNEMLNKKVRNYPVFMDYANIVTAITQQQAEGIPQEHITVLKDLIVAAEVSSYKEFEEYIEFLPDFFESNILFATRTKSWTYNGIAKYEAGVEEGKAVLTFSKVDLYANSRSDSIVIYATTGKCYPVAEKWVGQKGKMNFEKAGWSENEAMVELSNYTMQLDNSDYDFDTVTLTFPKHIDGKIKGSFSDKLYTSKPQNISYPRFKSYALDLNVKDIHPSVKTSGGFELKGDQIIIYGTAEKYADLVLESDGQKKATATSESFIVRTDRNEIYSANTEISMYLKKDSLFHPAVIFKFLMDENKMVLDRGEGIYVNVPYESPFHQMTIEANTVEWKLDESDIQFTTVDRYTGKPVAFTSYDHYVPQGELRYLTLSGRNPLRMLRDLSNSYGTDNLTGHDLAGQLGYPLKEVESIIFKLAKDGFVFYDPSTKDMRVNYKTHHYMDAGKGDIDYDHLLFVAGNAGTPLNGILNVDSQSIQLYGVEDFDLSLSKQVRVKPRGSQLKLLKDRDMELEGSLTAGKLLFKGKGINFDYEDFKVDMEAVDSLIIFVQGEEDPYGKIRDVPLRTVISGIKGTLFIDEPGNKSGVNDYQEFPYFTSYDTAYVYFDTPEDTTKFPRDKFYFEVLPFTLDSIVTTTTDSIGFAGRLVSNDIFNPFNTRLSTQPDLTLGIDENTPKEGIDIYKSSAKFFNNYKLLKKGLRGNGKIEYKQATLRSNDFEFFVDSLYAKLDTFTVTSSAIDDVPQANIGEAVVYWMPYQDSMIIDGEGNYNLYDEQLDFNGDLLYDKGVLYGISDSAMQSTFLFDGAVLKSSDAIFKQNHFETMNGSFEIKRDSLPIVLATYGNADVNFDKKELTVNNEADSFLVEIPGNFLESNITSYKWNMSDNTIKFENNEAGDQYFVSTLPVFDSIKIFAGNAVFDANENKLKANEINTIELADSRVIPPGKTLTILQGGTFEQMQNATLVLNHEKEYHTVEKVDLVVRSRNDFSGTGNFKYVGNTGKEYDVAIDEIKVVVDTLSESRKDIELGYSTAARGLISEEDEFRLDEQLLYKGNLFLSSTKKDIDFDGFARLDLKQNEDPSWFNLSQGIDPDSFSIALDSLKNEAKQDVVTGLFVSPGELDIYTAIMEPTRSTRDNVLYKADGNLYKGENSGEYIFGTKEAVIENSPDGSTLYYDDNTGKVEINGHVTWAPGIALVKVDGFGTLNYDPSTKITEATSVIAIDFPMDEKLWYQLPRDMVEYNYEAKQIDYNRPEIKDALSYFIKRESDKRTIIDDIEVAGLFKLPVDFSHKILLTDVELKWDPLDGNFKSINTIGLSSIAGYPIDQKVKAYTEFGYSVGSSYMNLYFEMADGEWYFFSTRRGKMTVLSSDQSFNEKVVNAENNEVKDGKKGPIIYEFQPGNMTAKVTFMSRFEDYLSRIGAE